MKPTAPILAGAILCLSLVVAPARADVDHYDIDAVHSFVDFKVRYLGLKWVNGSFTRFTGSMDFDPVDEGRNRIKMVAQAKSIDTQAKRRDDYLRGEDFFNVTTYPTITFTSSSLKREADGRYRLTGNLTLLATTNQITTHMSAPVAETGPEGEQRLSVELDEIVVKRSDYGMQKMIGPIGDEVHLFLNFSAVKK